MLPKPSILKIPDASTALTGGLRGCGSGYSGVEKCSSQFSCSPVSGSSCIDTKFSSTCSWTLGIGVGGAALGVGATVGITIT